jgi:hypothetical protein
VEKEDILREIKRTAKENGGKPLGRARFASETGIRYCDWAGKHWARWSDALRDAGLPPNRLNDAYDEAHLLAKLAEFAHVLGHLPVGDELRMKARTNPGFPSHNVFAGLGTKAQIVKRLREHCLARGGFDDVVRMCEAYSSPARTASEGTGGEVKTGFVYLMKSGRFYKIGHSGAPGRRQYDLAIQLPEEVKLIHKIPTEAPEAAERFWHERFKAKRRGGEWFDLTAADVKTFKRCRSM